MRKIFFNVCGIAILSLLVFLPFGCMKDKVKSTYTYKIYQPVFKTLSQIRADMKSYPATSLGQTGKIYIKGNYIFLNEINKGIHVIDNSDPKNPRNAAFINIPGNMDIAVKGSVLYADAYSDLVAFDISDPLNASKIKILDTVFSDRRMYYYSNTYPYQYDPDSLKVIVDWNVRDTTVTNNRNVNIYPACPNCEYLSAAAVPNAASDNKGNGGSMARFTVVNDYLYTVGYIDLHIFDISTASNPSFLDKSYIGMNIETIYPFKDKLFIGSGTGMYVYDIQSTPAQPVQSGQFVHARACDPVVADDDYAYVTLSEGSACAGFTNELQIVDIKNLNNAYMIKSYPMTHPKGLAKDGSTLFICDWKDGLKVYDASDVNNLQLIKNLKDGQTYDVIAGNKLAIVVAADGLYEYDYSNLENIHLISKLLLNKN